MARTSEDEIDRALDAVCAAAGLGGDDRLLVASLVGRPRRTWPACCGSGCDPCMRDIIAAAERVCAALGVDPG